MVRRYKVIDLFAGPGGLAEGFASYEMPEGLRPFEIELSIEKERSAWRTLKMRAFFRKFGNHVPDQYYDFLGGLASEAALFEQFSGEHEAAEREARQAELGTPQQRAVEGQLRAIASSGAETILIGGPPCQAYSLAGRSRNAGIVNYDPTKDHRHFLYRDYIRILRLLQPAAFVMENVKGILSAKVQSAEIFARILDDLRGAGGDAEYDLVAMNASHPERASDFLIKAEEHGIPQARHRVIVVGIRKGFGSRPISEAPWPRQDSSVTVDQVIGEMPKLRAGLSRTRDSQEAWQIAAAMAFMDASESLVSRRSALATEMSDYLRQASEGVRSQNCELPRSSTEPAPVPSPQLARWLVDARMEHLPNHETRGHMESDLARYAFAATFARFTGRSPNSAEFPADLAPRHRNWKSGKFADRFRVQVANRCATTITSHISKDGHYFIHPDPLQCRSLTVREAARLQTFPDNYVFLGNRTEQYVQVGNAVPPLLSRKIAESIYKLLNEPVSNSHSPPVPISPVSERRVF